MPYLRSIKTLLLLALLTSQHAGIQCLAQDGGHVRSLDEIGDDFFGTNGSTEVAGSLDFVDEGERPQAAEMTLPATLSDVPVDLSQAISPELQAWVRWVVLKNLPPSYEDNRKWGKTEQVYNGFRFRREGLKVETYTKHRTVKQGTWSRYYIEFVDPANQLEISINDLRPLASDTFAFRVNLRTPLRIFGRMSQWQRDVQLISLSTNADATVAMALDCECGIQMNPLTFPPDVKFSPRAKEANIVLEKFEVHRISQISGPLAEQLGKGLKRVLDDKLSSYNDKLVEKINRKLEKQEDRLTLKLHDRLNDTIKSWTTDSTVAPAP